ncbi:putative methyltransferase DDB_G0268948 [Panonychus citri]|uniref:putative methyltransferase DDB_G0268948 n=1 Tax=Panonychus citri TaxID=50023 RepID=UPI0023082B16|nr:putative methyltransferase DDB_G0268948 [Panonychus citri]
MTHRQYDSTGVASIYIEVRPSPPKDLIKSIINQLSQSVNPNPNGKWSRAVDVGCGSGQATFLLADYFDQVIGYDISEPQLQIANQRNQFNNVTFKISSGEGIPLEDNSVQLITVCEALHFFDIEKFNRKVDSLLNSGGLFVTIGYYPVPKLTQIDKPDLNLDHIGQSIDNLMQTWQEHGFPVKVFADMINTKYRCINLPFEKVCHEETFKTTSRRSADYIIDLINSLGTSEKFREKFPEKESSIMNQILNQLHDTFGTKDLSSIQLDVTFEYFIICFRK